MWDSAVLLVLLAALLLGCKRSGQSEAGGDGRCAFRRIALRALAAGRGRFRHSQRTPRPRRASTANAPCSIVRETVGFGSRPIGSAAHHKLEAYIHQKLTAAHVAVADDAFTAQTAAGPYPIRNIIAKFPGKKDGIIVVAGHYDTNLPLPTSYVGANDGGSSTGLLLELAEVLRGRQLEGYSVWLVWLDGEEATVKWTDTDSLYGSRHLAQLWQQDGTAKKIKAFLLLDMVGDADLNIDRDINSTVWLEDLVRDCGHPAGLPVALLRPADRRRRRSPAVCQTRRPGSRPHRLRLRLRQRLPPHPAGHARQTQSRQPANRRRHGAGNHPGIEHALSRLLKIFSEGVILSAVKDLLFASVEAKQILRSRKIGATSG